MSQRPSLSVATVDPDPVAPTQGGRPWLVYGLLLMVALAAIWYGIGLRRDLYRWSDPIRFTGDISNAWHWGTIASRTGVVALYDDLYQRNASSGMFELDYPPARLWLVTQWAKWTRAHFPDAAGWQRSYEFSKPMLLGNTLAELLSALAVFLIIRKQLLRSWTDPLAERPRCGDLARASLAGFAGALCLWFNPGVLFDAHAFPQWDLWIMPAMLFAVLLAMGGRFFSSGLLIGIGMLIKGQILSGAGILVLWPLFAGNWRGLLAVICGLLVSVALLTWCWLVRGLPAHVFVLSVLIAGLIPVLWFRKWRYLHIPLGMAGLAALLCVGFFDGSLSWWKLGFEFGSQRYAIMYSGGTSNLCTILQERFRVVSPTQIVHLWPLMPMPLKTLLTGVFLVALVICGMGAARHFAQRDARFLAAIAAPFVLFYTLMPQMHDRYLVWGAAATALVVGMGVGMTLLHLAITFIMWAAIMWNLCHQNMRWWPELTRFLERIHTDIGWSLLVLAGVLLYQAAPRWPWSRRERVLKATAVTAAAP